MLRTNTKIKQEKKCYADILFKKSKRPQGNFADKSDNWGVRAMFVLSHHNLHSLICGRRGITSYDMVSSAISTEGLS